MGFWEIFMAVSTILLLCKCVEEIQGYTGSIKVKLYNHGREPYIVMAGDKISQLVIVPVQTPALEVVSDLEETERGDNGFGSSGK